MERTKDFSDVKWGLLRCPFCGAHAYMEEHSRAFINGSSTLVAYVRCKKCNARSGRFPLSKYGKSSHSIEACVDAAKAWNQRTEVERG